MQNIIQEISCLSSKIVEELDICAFYQIDQDNELSKRLLSILLVETLSSKNKTSSLVIHLSNYLYFSSVENKEKLLDFLKTGRDRQTFENINDETYFYCDTWQVFTYRYQKYIEALSEKIPSINKIRSCEENLLKKLISDTYRAYTTRFDDLLENAYEEKHQEDYENKTEKVWRDYDRNANRM